MSGGAGTPVNAPNAWPRTAFCLIAACLFAIGYQYSVASRSPIIARDGLLFIRVAKALSIAPGETMRAQAQHPGYPAAILLVRQFLPKSSGRGDLDWWILAGRLVAGTCGVLCILVIWLLTREVFSQSAANVAALLFSVLPVVQENAADVLSDVPHLLFYLLSAWTACKAVASGRWAWYCLTGILSGIAFLIRPEGLAVAMILCALTAVGFLITSGRPKSHRVLNLIVVILAVSAIAGPYMLYTGRVSRKISDKLVLPPSATQQRKVDLGDAPHKDAISRRIDYAAVGVANLDAANHSFNRLAVAARALAGEYAERANFLILPLFLVAVWPRRIHVSLAGHMVIWPLAGLHCALLIWLFMVAEYLDRRHVIPLVVLSLPAASAGTIYLANLIHTGIRKRVPLRSSHLLSVLVGGAVAAMLTRAAYPIHLEYLPQHEAIRWLSGHLQPDDQLVTNCIHIPFHLDRQATLVDRGQLDVPRCLCPPDRHNCRKYVVLDVTAIGHFEPDWLRFVEPNYSLVAEFHGTGKANYRTVRVYLSVAGPPRIASFPKNEAVLSP